MLNYQGVLKQEKASIFAIDVQYGLTYHMHIFETHGKITWKRATVAFQNYDTNYQRGFNFKRR